MRSSSPYPTLRDRGASLVEYVAVIALASALAATLLFVFRDQGRSITAAAENALCRLLGGECAEDSPEPAETGSSADRASSAAPEAESVPLNAASRAPDPESGWPNAARLPPEPITSGRVPEGESPFYDPTIPNYQDQQAAMSEADYRSLGEGYDGRFPVSPWVSLGCGALRRGDPMCCPGRTCETIDEVRRTINASRAACRVGNDRFCLPHSADYFEHFLEGSGEEMEVDMEVFLNDVPEFGEEIERHQQLIIERALEDAEERGIDGPLTYPIHTPSLGWGYPEDDIDGTQYVYADTDWANAIGSFHYHLEGEITVYPPETPGGEPTYSLDTTVHMEKFYNWDREWTDPALRGWRQAAGGSYSQADLAELHQYGMAQEYWVRGSTELPTVEG